MSELEFLRRVAHCKEAQESAADDASRAEWVAMAAQWQRLAEEAAKTEQKRAKREATRQETPAPGVPPTDGWHRTEM
jgi:hypothetical protein